MSEPQPQGQPESVAGLPPAQCSAVFPLGHVLSVTTGRLCCEIGGVYEILNHITGDNLFTHSLPRASRFAAPLILADHPELAVASSDAEMKRLSYEVALAIEPMAGVRKWLSGLKLRTEYEIASHADVWPVMDPLAELEGMAGKEKVVVVCAPEPPND